MSLNSVQMNRLITRKQIVEEAWRKKTFADIKTGPQVSADKFHEERGKVSRQPSGVMTTTGKLVTEKILQASRDEHKYFENVGKIFTKEALKESEYKRQIPDYLRLMEDPRNQVKPTDGMVTVVSKNQGWITLTPRSMNRRKPLER